MIRQWKVGLVLLLLRMVGATESVFDRRLHHRRMDQLEARVARLENVIQKESGPFETQAATTASSTVAYSTVASTIACVGVLFLSGILIAFFSMLNGMFR